MNLNRHISIVMNATSYIGGIVSSTISKQGAVTILCDKEDNRNNAQLQMKHLQVQGIEPKSLLYLPVEMNNINDYKTMFEVTEVLYGRPYTLFNITHPNNYSDIGALMDIAKLKMKYNGKFVNIVPLYMTHSDSHNKIISYVIDSVTSYKESNVKFESVFIASKYILTQTNVKRNKEESLKYTIMNTYSSLK